jgi:uncharacterized protein (TIGR03437 family)
MRTRYIVLCAVVLSWTATAQTYTIKTLAGGALPVNIPGTSDSLGPSAPQYIAADSPGNLFFVDQGVVLRLDAATGVLTLVAGNGTPGFGGDNGPATSAQLFNPEGVAVDSVGNVYIADSRNNRVRKVSNGVITTVAGNGTGGFGGDNGPATGAQLWGPAGVAVDSAGNLFIADTYNYRIREVSGGTITTVAGGETPGFGGDNGPATSAQLLNPLSVTVDAAGNLYIADRFNNSIRKVSNGVISTVAGSWMSGFSGDNGPATSALLSAPMSVAVDSAGNLYIADHDNNRIRKVSGGLITTVAGGGSFLGDSGPATSALLSGASGVAVDSAGRIYIADTGNNRIRRVSNGVITTVAGNGGFSFFGDNGPATSAQLYHPEGVAVDSGGSLYIADSGNQLVRKVSNGVITAVAGNGTPGFSGDNGPAIDAQLSGPNGVAVDSAGNLYIADSGNFRIRKVSNGVIATVAGGGSFLGDTGPASSAWLWGPEGIAMDSADDFYIADAFNNRIREVSNGVITAVAGDSGFGYFGDNGPAPYAALSGPQGVAVDSAGDLYIADTGNNCIRKVSNGVITTVAGNGTYGFSGDNGPATSAQVNQPWGVAVDSAGNLYVSDTGNNRIRKVSNGVITTVAGNGTRGFSGDGGPATSAQVNLPAGVAVDSAGNVYFADRENNRIRVLTPAAAIPQTPTIVRVVNAASYIGGTVSPGELVTIFGTGIGPATAAGAIVDPATGKLATTIGGVQVLFSGVPAPMIYASSTQVSAVAPYEMASVANASVRINFAGETSNADQVTLAVTAPGLFAQNASGSGPGAILNQDNSLNGPGHPAARGSIVQVFMTGEGQTSPAGITGAITTATLPPPQVTPAPLQFIQVSIGGQQALWTYAGEAPGMVAGVMQLNVQIPTNAPSGALPIQVSLGGNMSQSGITVAVQ